MCLHACPAAVQLSFLTPYQDSPSLQDHVAKSSQGSRRTSMSETADWSWVSQLTRRFSR